MKSIRDIVSLSGTGKKGRIEQKKGVIDEKTVLFLAERVITSQYGIRGRENIIPKAFKEKKLFFLCRSSLWMNELWMNRDVIIGKMNSELGADIVSDLKMTEMF